MRPDQYENNAEGILCVYKNPKWLVCIKNWKPDNDIAGIAHLEIHHSTDEQFILPLVRQSSSPPSARAAASRISS